MNEKNFEYLKEQLKHTGFGESLYPELANKISQGAADFQLSLRGEFGKDGGTATLAFRKGGKGDMYFFNHYHLQVENSKGENKDARTFYINREGSITLKEAYNLLEGRAVFKSLTNKEGGKYNAWLQLDKNKTSENGNYEIKQYHQNYGYDLPSVLAKYPIKELKEEDSKQNLLRSLERGNVQAVTFLKEGKEERLFITPNVAFKTLSIYNSAGVRVSPTEVKIKEEQSSKQEQKQERKTTPVIEKEVKPKQNKKRTQKM